MLRTKLKNPEVPRVGVGGLIIDDERRVLLLLRKRPPEVGQWSIPGGKVEFLEPIEEALKREVKEELGVEVEIVSLLGVTNHIVLGENVHWVSPCYLMKIVTGRPKVLEPEKNSKMKWFSVDNLPSNLAIPADKAIHFFLSSPAKPDPALGETPPNHSPTR